MSQYIIKGIDPDLWKRVKVAAAQRETTVKALVVAFLETLVLDVEKRP